MYIIVYRYITYILYHPISNVFLSDFSQYGSLHAASTAAWAGTCKCVENSSTTSLEKNMARIHGEFMALDTQKNEVNLENN